MTEDEDPQPLTAKARAARPLIAAVYDRCMVGGNLHIVLDDGNVEAAHIVWCIERPSLTPAERECAIALLSMSEDERLAAIAYYHETARSAG